MKTGPHTRNNQIKFYKMTTTERYTKIYSNEDFHFIAYPDGTKSCEANFSTRDYGPGLRVILDARDMTIEEIALAKNCLESRFPGKIALYIPYFPGAREDRNERWNGDFDGKYRSVSIQVYTNIINSLNFNQVIILDPHSDVTPNLIDRVKVLNWKQYATEAIGEFVNNNPYVKDWSMVIPDLGAAKKMKNFMPKIKKIQCMKERDPETGKLSGFKVLADEVKKNLIIVDDICDGGGTFLGIAEKLREKGAENIFLYTTHGIYSKGLHKLCEEFNQVISTDSIGQTTENPNNYSQIKIPYQHL